MNLSCDNSIITTNMWIQNTDVSLSNFCETERNGNKNIRNVGYRQYYHAHTTQLLVDSRNKKSCG